MNNITLAKRNSAIFLATLLILGTIATILPSVQAQPYYGQDNNYKKTYGKDVTVKSVKCNNINVNVNGLELEGLPPFLGNPTSDENGNGYGDASSYGNSEKIYENAQQSGYNKDFKFVCVNNNNNTVVEEEKLEPPIPPEPPTITSLIVNKEIFGCDNISGNPPVVAMNCQNLQADDPGWISCDDPPISNTIFCQFLTEDFFDIEVLDDQGNQIAQFEGSVEGETNENLEPGTYTVNEIKVNTPPFNVLRESSELESQCIALGFDDAGIVDFVNGVETIFYAFCIEYEDEQGNDCSTITLAAGEERTCTVKNYIERSFSNLDSS